MKKIIILCMILFVFIVGCEKATSPGVNSKIQGTVLDHDGNPVADAKILVNFNIDCDYPIGGKSGMDLYQYINPVPDSVDPGPPIPPTEILGSYPNPFINITTILFQLGSSCMLSLCIESLSSEEIVRIIDNDSLAAHAMHSVSWDGKNNDDKNIQNGLYKVILYVGDEMYSDTLFIFKEYNDFNYDTLTPLCKTNQIGNFTIYTKDLPLNYVGDYFDTDGCNPGNFSVTPYIDIWAFHQDYSPVYIDSLLVESGKNINVSLTFE